MGGRKPTVTDEEILSIFSDAADPVLSAPEVAEEITIGEQGTYQRLQDLENQGLLESKKIGQGRAWWITSEGQEIVKG